MAGTKHLHRYERAFLGKKGTYEVFRCNLPECTHYLPKRLVKGKLSICNRCGGELIMDTRSMNLEKPHCVDCIQVRSKLVENKDAVLDFIESFSTESTDKI